MVQDGGTDVAARGCLGARCSPREQHAHSKGPRGRGVCLAAPSVTPWGPAWTPDLGARQRGLWPARFWACLVILN